MSEVDRLSNSGLYPALPIADKQHDPRGSGRPPRDPPHAQPDPGDGPAGEPGAATPRPPKSLIDEYA